MEYSVLDAEQTCMNLSAIFSQSELKVKDIQKACGLTSRQAVYNWFERRCMPSIDNLIILSSLLDVKLDDIIATRKVG